MIKSILENAAALLAFLALVAVVGSVDAIAAFLIKIIWR
jgi:hypothetical protein